MGQIFISSFPLTQERREELNKLVKKEGENSYAQKYKKISKYINIKSEKDKKISKDFERDYT